MKILCGESATTVEMTPRESSVNASTTTTSHSYLGRSSSVDRRHRASVDSLEVDESSAIGLERQCRRRPWLRWFHRWNETKSSSDVSRSASKVFPITYFEKGEVLVQIDLHGNHWIAIGLRETGEVHLLIEEFHH